MKASCLAILLPFVLALTCVGEPFDQTLDGDGFTVLVTAPNAGDHNTVIITPSGLLSVNDPLEVPAESPLTRAFLADMDGDNSPELFLIFTNPGSGSYGEALAFCTNRKKSLTPIVIQKPEEKDLSGYLGHDEYEVVENTFVRRFPVYNKGDVNAAPTGGWRQFQYKLKPGEASWQMKIDRVASFGGADDANSSSPEHGMAPSALAGSQMKYADNHGHYVYTFFEDGLYRFASMSQNETAADSREGRYTYAVKSAGGATITFDHEPAIRLLFSDPLNATGTIEGDDRTYSFRIYRSDGE
ncbi:MAG: hypothetical protein WCI38_00720 [Chthoniobacterales bacterium]